MYYLCNGIIFYVGILYIAIANLRAVLEAMARSNTAPPHPIASGVMMPGVVVLVSNLNEKVRICVGNIHSMYVLSVTPFSSCFVHFWSHLGFYFSVLQMITPHALFILFGTCINFSLLYVEQFSVL